MLDTFTHGGMECQVRLRGFLLDTLGRSRWSHSDVDLLGDADWGTEASCWTL